LGFVLLGRTDYNAKSEAEKHIQYLATKWVDESGVDIAAGDHPSFSALKDWLSTTRQSACLDFRSKIGALYEAEMWFDQELKRAWRTN